MGTVLGSACSDMGGAIGQLSCQFVVKGKAGETFDKIEWTINVHVYTKEDSEWNVKFENLTKGTTIHEGNFPVVIGEVPSPSYGHKKTGILTENITGDTLKLTVTKTSGSLPARLSIFASTNTIYSD